MDYTGKMVRYKAGRFEGIGEVVGQTAHRVTIKTSKGTFLIRKPASIMGLVQQTPEPGPFKGETINTFTPEIKGEAE